MQLAPCDPFPGRVLGLVQFDHVGNMPAVTAALRGSHGALQALPLRPDVVGHGFRTRS